MDTSGGIDAMPRQRRRYFAIVRGAELLRTVPGIPEEEVLPISGSGNCLVRQQPFPLEFRSVVAGGTSPGFATEYPGNYPA